VQSAAGSAAGAGAASANSSTEPAWTGAPGYIGHGTQVVVDGVTSLDVPYPSGIQYHDILILQVYGSRNTGTPTISTPSGWNLISSGNARTDGVQQGGTYWKRADGTESGTVHVTVNVSSPSSHYQGGMMSIVRGCVATGTPYEALASNFGTSTTPTGSAVTTTGSDRLVTNLIGRGGGFATATVAPAAGWTEEFEVAGTVLGQFVDFIWHDRVAASAATIAAEATTSSDNANWRVDSLAFLPR
jgi:hypothetical protein